MMLCINCLYDLVCSVIICIKFLKQSCFGFRKNVNTEKSYMYNNK